MNLVDKQHPLLFLLPYQIASKDQRFIVDYAYNQAESWSGQVQVWNHQKKQHEDNNYFGRVQIRRLSLSSQQDLGSEYNLDWINWAARLAPDQEWEWIDTPVTNLLRHYVSQVQHLYHSVHRVLLLVQQVGSNIPLHTDRVVKNHYPDGIFQPGPAQNLPLASSHIHRQHNRYLALKWPLTEIPGNNGSPIIDINGTVWRYDVGQNCFAINEVDVKHGAFAVNHRRGVIFLDGILNYERLRQESWLQVKIQPVNSE